MTARPILLVDTQKKRRSELKKRLMENGLQVIETPSLEESMAARVEGFALILEVCDEQTPESGIRLPLPDTPVFVLAQHRSVELAIRALRVGVSDYFHMPLEYDQLLTAIQRTTVDVVQAASLPRDSLDSSAEQNREPIIGQCLAMQNLIAYAKRVAASDCNVLISGETGTGKELVAALIHRYSPRRLRPFVCVNCAAIPDTLLESELFGHERGAFTGANWRTVGKLASGEGGTVFLDEIGEMSPCGQAKVLRMIESKEIQRLGSHSSLSVNVRVVAATNKDLDALVAENSFRRDLYYRLSVASISLLPLRERGGDIPHLLHYYIKVLNRKYGQGVQGVSPEAMSVLLHYDWPGNVRELKNVLESIYVSATRTQIGAADLPEKILRSTASCGRNSDRERLTRTLEVCNWNKSKAAEQLNWSRMTLYRKMALYGINLKSRTVGDVASQPRSD